MCVIGKFKSKTNKNISCFIINLQVIKYIIPICLTQC